MNYHLTTILIATPNLKTGGTVFHKFLPLFQVPVIMAFLLSACQSAAPVLPTAASTPVLPTPTKPILPTVTVTSTPAPMAFSEPGPYAVGVRKMNKYIDASRGDRPVTLTIWYPIAKTSDAQGGTEITDAPPDLSNAPYPVILSSTKMGFFLAPHFVSYGFAVMGVNGQDSAMNWGTWLTDYPLDLVFGLDQLASNPPQGLEGVLDTDHAGAVGYSFDGYTSLALSGARVDPAFYQNQCAQAGMLTPAPAEWWLDYICNIKGGWDAFVANAGTSITTSEDGLWKPFTDSRIRAVIPMGPEGAWLFGERGLAAADRPVLIIAAAADSINIYDIEAVYIFNHINNPPPVMISFIGQDHGMIYDPAIQARLKHFTVAFFGYHLQGKTDYARWFSEDFVNQYGDLAWGVYEKK